MTDLAPGDAATRSCPSCGAQNDGTRTTCEKCGTALPDHLDGDAQREDLDVTEVARGVASVGYDAEFRLDGASLECPNCGRSFDLSEVTIDSGQPANDTTSGGTENEVITVTCPSCDTSGHAVVRIPDDDGAT